MTLILAVSIMATALAYLHHPKWKALMLSLPISFTIATLAVNRPLDATNVVAMVVLLIYTHGVRIMHTSFRMPIALSIAVSAVAYCGIGSVLANVLPSTDIAFGISCAGVFLVAASLYKFTPPRKEPGHRSPLPVWIKFPAIMLVITLLVIIRKSLHGFITMFPMVGVVASYEACHSLWTMARQIPIVMLTMLPMMIVIRLVQKPLGILTALALGWVVVIIMLIVLTRLTWAADKKYLEAIEND